MYAQTIPLNETEHLELNWHWRFRDFRVFYRGIPLGPPVGRKALKVGQTYALPDGRRVTVVLRKSGLEVWHEQVELIRGVRSGTVNYFFTAADGFGERVGTSPFGLFLPNFLLSCVALRSRSSTKQGEGPLAAVASSERLAQNKIWLRSLQKRSSNTLCFLGIVWIGMCFFLRSLFPEMGGGWAFLLVAPFGLIPIALGLWARFTLSLTPLRIGFILLCVLIVKRLWDVVLVQGKLISLDMIVLAVIALTIHSAIQSAPPRKRQVRYVKRKGPSDVGSWW